MTQNSFKKLTRTARTLLLALTAAVALPGAALADRNTLINLEEAAEVSELSITVTGNNRGTIFARICDECPMLRLEVNEDTQITRGLDALSLAETQTIKHAGATVLFEPKSLLVTRILYWR